MNGVKILIVDDELDMLQFLSARLIHKGYEVTTARNGWEALEVLDRQGVDIVITDVRMPGMSGIDLLRQIRERKPEIEVIVLTGHGSMQDAIKALRESGGFDYLLKPLKDPAQLEKVILRALEMRHLKRQIALHERHRALYQMSRKLTQELSKPMNSMEILVNELAASLKHTPEAQPILEKVQDRLRAMTALLAQLEDLAVEFASLVEP